MRTALDRVISLLSDNRDYLLLALAVLVLVEGAIIVLWARRAIQLRRSLAEALADAERSAAKAAAAVKQVNDTPKTYRVADAMRSSDTAAPAATAPAPAEATAPATAPTPPPATAPGRLSAAPPPAPQQPVAQAPAPAPAEPTDYTTPVAEKAAAWVLPEVEASRSDQAETPPEPPKRQRPELVWSAEETALSGKPATPASSDPAPTTLGWSGTSVPVEPAPDFAVITDPDAVAGAAPPAKAAQPVNGNGNGHSNGNGNGNSHKATVLRDAVAWATPVAPEAAPPAAAPSWDLAMFDSNEEVEALPTGGDVLLVEDDPTITRLYRVLLESRGYSVRVAADGLEGLDRVNEKRPDLVLLDIMMPRMNGIAFLQALRAGRMSDVPVVVLSNFMEKQLVDDALALGALEYMVKAQTRPEALAGALPHWLRGERAFSS